MRAILVALTLAMAAVQSVAFTQCCCAAVCKHPNDPCSDCGHAKPRNPEPC